MKNNDKFRCWFCKNELSQGATICPNCKVEISDIHYSKQALTEERECAVCGALVPMDANVCPKCWASVRKNERVAANTIPYGKGPVKRSQTPGSDQEPTEGTTDKPVIQKTQVELAPDNIRTYNSSDELRDEILRGEVDRTLRARTVQYKDGNPKPDDNWSTVEQIALSESNLRSLYRPVWNYTLRFLGYGALAGIFLKAIDTTVAYCYLDPLLAMLWIMLIIAHILSVKWGAIIPLAWFVLLVLSFHEGMPNFCFIFFLATLTTAFVGFIFGAPCGMIIGTFVGHLKRKRIPKAPDAGPEGWRPYLLGIILPLVFLLVLTPLYLRVST